MGSNGYAVSAWRRATSEAVETLLHEPPQHHPVSHSLKGNVGVPILSLPSANIPGKLIPEAIPASFISDPLSREDAGREVQPCFLASVFSTFLTKALKIKPS